MSPPFDGRFVACAGDSDFSPCPSRPPGAARAPAERPGAAPPGFAPGHGAPRMCAPFAAAAGSGEPGLGGLWRRRGEAGSSRERPREHGWRPRPPPRRRTGPCRLASHFAAPWGSWQSRRILPKGCLCRNESGPDPAAAKVGEDRMRPFIISSLLLPSPLGGVRGGNNRHQVLYSLFSVCLLKY